MGTETIERKINCTLVRRPLMGVFIVVLSFFGQGYGPHGLQIYFSIAAIDLMAYDTL